MLMAQMLWMPIKKERLELHKKHFEPYSEYVSWNWSTMGEYFKQLEENGVSWSWNCENSCNGLR